MILNQVTLTTIEGTLRRAGTGVSVGTSVFKKKLDFSDIDFIREKSDLPGIVKGVLTPENARECVNHGASAIQVSSYGGRQLDGVPASRTALRGIIEAVVSGVRFYCSSVASHRVYS